ncbi:DUF4389 domain-containing protein [Marinicellulosiphila megalodicopiae]|uniref:DUF4389 domain-containing protein n=1 Tax=Marinicellulosiphila megalodicopiae TaxID=2724896 RepID=UPI003BAEDC1A
MNKKYGLDENIIRFFVMILYAFVLNISISVIMIIGFVQWLMRIIRDDEIVRLTQFSANLNEYNYQIGQFLTLNEEQKPFPFSDWPDSQDLVKSDDTEFTSEKSNTQSALKEKKLSPEDIELKNKANQKSQLNKHEDNDLTKEGLIIDQNLTDDEQLDSMKEADA